MAVGFEHAPNPEASGKVEQHVVFVGRIEQHGITGLAAPQYVDVVVDRADDHLVDLGSTVAV
jgi:hypothetical protein